VKVHGALELIEMGSGAVTRRRAAHDGPSGVQGQRPWPYLLNPHQPLPQPKIKQLNIRSHPEL
jgi:hypothetical protein